MIFDASAVDRETFRRNFDVCVVGSGFAGVTLARSLAGRGLHVALMEAGGLDFSGDSQDLYQGEIVGHEYYDLDVTRLRYFGGSSNHWGGRCRALETHDFEPHPYHPLSGWPIRKRDLDPYAEMADEILDLPPIEALPDRAAEGMEAELKIIRFQQSHPPTLLAQKYKDEIATANLIELYFNANLVDLRLDEGHSRITEAIFKTYATGDPGFAVQARSYCLCLGGIENPRALLNARSQIPTGLGNRHDLVGRFFCEHPTVVAGKVLFEDDVPPPASLAPTAELMRESEILNFNMLLHTRGRELGKELARDLICTSDFSERLAARVLGRPIDCEVGGFGETIAGRWSDDYQTGNLGLIIEQALNPSSRVFLTQRRDGFGLARPALDWRLSELDFQTLRTAVLIMGRLMAEQGLGRVQIAEWLRENDRTLPPIGGEHQVALHHHMCTTRMSENPREGVVDGNCRVHELENLYLGGSSVFATVGYANPTYTIVQLALRLGDHLAAMRQP
jgi:hypothetical protein